MLFRSVEAEVPLRARYDEGNESSPAERSSLIVLGQLSFVEVKAVPDKIPDVLEYDGEKLVEIGDQVTVADLIVPDGVEVLTEPEHVVATVYEPSALAAANDAVGGQAEPEEAETIPVEGESTEESKPDSESGTDDLKENEDSPKKQASEEK